MVFGHQQQLIKYFICMNSSIKSGFLLTEQTRYSEDIFNSGLNSIRKRINILSTINVSSPSLQYPLSISNPQACNNGGMMARVAKIMFQAEILQQDLKSQTFELRKTRKYLDMVNDDLRRSAGKLERYLQMKLNQLGTEVNSTIDQNLQRNRKLVFQTIARRQKSDQLSEKLAELRRRVKHMEDMLGCYTGLDKLQQT